MGLRRSARWGLLLGAAVAISIAGATVASAFFFIEAADRECLDRSAELAPPDVLFLSERTSLLVEGEQTLFPIGLRCAWPTERGTIRTDDGWGRTLLASGSLLVAGTAGYIALRRDSDRRAADRRADVGDGLRPRSSSWM